MSLLLFGAAGSGVVADGEQLRHDPAGVTLLVVGSGAKNDGALEHVGMGALPDVRCAALLSRLHHLGAEGQAGGEGARDAERVEATGLSLDGAVSAVPGRGVRGGEAELVSDLARQPHGLPSDEVGDRIVEAARPDGEPGSGRSSNVARKWPGVEARARLIWPLMPETVLTDAPSNRATSRAEANIPLTKTVFLKIL
ncbi:hypothetical protein L249_4085 [Ophiocordyceps polyrhachis-furcata BCC 54312]|uniref:Uncharacterized protein n=1 Tax=Ophiocordyceps polyrhachis-furcata BCC 54312 TaxID=1330021 RepID=A0A367L522_9HYPO|nr:hypothetical protein L249_4085 [Ophiocordyceps polyrhachis-furcata BCC 54312]